MTDIYIPKDYPVFSEPEEIARLFDPIVKYTNIDYAGYGRIYADGGHFYMDNLVELQDYLLNRLKGDTVFDFQLLDLIAHDSSFLRADGKIIVFEQDIDSKNYWKRTSKMFNIESLLYVFEKHEEYFDIFAFASRSGQNISSFYIAHFDVLEKFMLFFKEKNKDLITQSERKKIILIKRNKQFYCIKRDLKGHSSIQEKNVPSLQHLKLDKYPLEIDGDKLYITCREVECWKLFSIGYSHKKIANVLGVSPKTVDTHLINVKNKLRVTSRDSLSKIFHGSTLACL